MNDKPNREAWDKIAKNHYDRLGPCSFFGDKGLPGGHIYGADDTHEHCQLCGHPRLYNEGKSADDPVCL